MDYEEELKGWEIKGKADVYTVIEYVAKGGFGEIWKAERKSNHQPVAIKKLLSKHRSTSSSIDKFFQEGALTERLDHPNILHTYEVGIDPKKNICFLVTDFLDHDLSVYLRKEREIDSSSAQKIIVLVAEGLHYAHTQGVLHRDVHPRNILIDKDGQVYLSDFGIAKVLEESPLKSKIDNFYSNCARVRTKETSLESELAKFGVTDTGDAEDSGSREIIFTLARGNPAYASLEVLRRGIKVATAKSDQFSLGQVAYELFKVIGDQRLCKVAETAMKIDPDTRFPSVNDFKETLQTVPDYLHQLRSYQDIGKRLGLAELEQLYQLAQKAHVENPVNKPLFQPILGQVEDEQVAQYAQFLEELVQNTGKKDIQPAVLELQKKVVPVLREIEKLAGRT